MPNNWNARNITIVHRRQCNAVHSSAMQCNARQCNGKYSLTCLAAMQIYFNRLKCLHKKRVELHRIGFVHQHNRHDTIEVK